jgi:hypothetical protein
MGDAREIGGSDATSVRLQPRGPVGLTPTNQEGGQLIQRFYKRRVFGPMIAKLPNDLGFSGEALR